MVVKWEMEAPRIRTHELTLRDIANLKGEPGLITAQGYVVAVIVPVVDEEEAKYVKAKLQAQDHD
jgi:antitoxin (DNA-binding transcriptional repressor) of toxin-antitoxin stability system